jgi:hypothetical protein
MYEFIIGGVLILMALIGSHWMMYRRGYYKGVYDMNVAQYEREERIDWEYRANYNSNYEELPMFLKRQAD